MARLTSTTANNCPIYIILSEFKEHLVLTSPFWKQIYWREKITWPISSLVKIRKISHGVFFVISLWVHVQSWTKIFGVTYLSSSLLLSFSETTKKMLLIVLLKEYWMVFREGYFHSCLHAGCGDSFGKRKKSSRSSSHIRSAWMTLFCTEKPFGNRFIQ
jgi:hypothetical protein